MNNIKTALTWGFTVLDKNSSEARLEAELLLSHLLEKNRAFLFTYPEYSLSESQIKAYRQAIDLRIKGTPIAYIIGQREFWSLPLKINRHTLIPRHETECLVELALTLLPQERSLDILDLGTGSGAIALAIASERPHWHITACDQSPEALIVAQDNAQSLQIKNITFHQSNWFDSIPAQKYHAILSNPPYIAQNDEHLNQGDLRFEPLSALVSGQEGLADLQYIIANSYNKLESNGLLLLEHGYKQKDALEQLLAKSGYCEIHCWSDLAGHHRVSGGRKPQVQEI